MTIVLIFPSNSLTKKLCSSKIPNQVKKVSSVIKPWSIWIYSIDCASWRGWGVGGGGGGEWFEEDSKIYHPQWQMWVPSYMVPIISGSIDKGLSSWHVPVQIWVWPIIYPYKCIRVKLRFHY